MCMAATYRTKEHYFGRNLDYEFSYGERVVVVPRKHRFDYRHVPADDDHLAIWIYKRGMTTDGLSEESSSILLLTP